MKAELNSLYTALRGAHLDNVNRSTEYGTIVSPKVIPTNPKTDAQTAVRSAFAQAAQSYAGLTPTQQAGWENLGAQTKVTNNVGATYSLSGQQAHISINGVLSAAGQATVTDAPAKQTALALPPLSLTARIVGGVLQIKVTPTAQYAGLVIVYGTKPVSAGTSKPTKSLYRKIAVTNALLVAGYDVSTAYTNKYPTAPVLGQKIGVELVPVSASGHKGIAVKLLATVTA